MKKDLKLSVRVSKPMKDAIQKEADKEGRTISNLAFKVINDWLHERRLRNRPQGGKA